MPDNAPTSTSLARRITGIAALFGCALVVDPARVVDQTTSLAALSSDVVLHALIIPALAAVGLWLVLPNLTVLAICVFMLSIAHSQPGSSDLFAGYLYPALALAAAALLVRELFGTASRQQP